MLVPIDFHLHTWCSDGAVAPRELVHRVRTAGVAIFAITDHDTLAGWRAVCGEPGLIPGVEVTAGDAAQEVHIVALGIRPADPVLGELLSDIRARRRLRLAAILERLPREVRRGLIVDDLRDHRAAEAGETLGRYHLARALAQRGGVDSVRSAFTAWLSDEHVTDPSLPGFPSVGEVVAAIRQAGGVAILAHPGVYRQWPRIAQLMALGFDGIESGHAYLDPTLAAGIEAEAAHHGWLLSYGSDWHAPGARSPGGCSLAKDRLRPLAERLGFSLS